MTMSDMNVRMKESSREGERREVKTAISRQVPPRRGPQFGFQTALKCYRCKLTLLYPPFLLPVFPPLGLKSAGKTRERPVGHYARCAKTYQPTSKGSKS
jgi:hypothetical protein